MNRHGSMNRVYRLIWSCAQSAWIPVAELAHGRGKSSLRKISVAALSLASGAALAGPGGGQVTAGTGTIAQAGLTTTVNQASQNLSLSWQSFNIAPQETVNFVQPSASAIAVNRIHDTNGSQILGHLNANGQVYLINPNGVLFGRGAQVNVGGLVASTLDVNDASLTGDKRSFSGNGAGSVINRGTINAANGGYVALLANHVSNEGAITAANGVVAVGAGSVATLTFSNNNLVAMQVDTSVLNSQADNGGLIRADGGIVMMTAGAKDSLLASVVNNTGVIEARTVENHDGKIILLGGMQAGSVNVAGTLDASAPSGGNGGFIETSAAQVQVADEAKITTAAAMGLAGTWLIDPVDFTIAASGGNMTGAALSSNLGGGDIVIQSTSGNSGTLGDVNVNDVVSWSAHKLTLNAQNNININANLNASGSASLALEYGQGAVAAGNTSNIITHGASVNLPAGTDNFTTKQGSDGTVKAYTVITALGAAGSTTGTDLQGIGSSVSTHNFALGADIDASATSGWNAGAGFLPDAPNFTGTFDGLGHTINNLTINRPSTSRVGLFENIGTGGVVRNVGLVGGSVTGNSMVGGLVGEISYGTVSNSYATGAVTGSSYTGGLVGNNYGGAISNSYATGAVTGSGYTGGLVGSNNYGGSTINNSYASGTVNSTGSAVGGLAGRSNGTVSNSYASGAVNTTGTTVGGLVGYNASMISNSYASGAVNGSSSVGGLAGFNNGTVTASFWDITTSGQATSAGGVGMTTANMQSQANFTSATAANGNVNPDWDLANTWIVYAGHTSPLLRSFMTALTVTANNATKTYNGLAYSGGNGVTYSTTPNSNLLGTLSYGGTSQSAKNAGSYVITGSGLYSNQQGYLISYINGALTVNKANLTLSGTRAYNGTTVVAGSVLTATGVHGETFTVTGAGNSSNLASKNVQTGSALASITGLALGTSGNGGLSSNYNALSRTGSSVSITKANLSLSGTRAYDGSSAVAGGVLTATGVAGETFAVTGTGNSSNLASRNVQTGSALASITGLALGTSGNGGLSSNYNALSKTGSSVSITKANLTLNGTRAYDGSSTVAGGVLTATGVAGETFAVTGAGDTTNLASRNVQTGSALASISGLALGTSGNGGLSSNYNILSTTGSTVSVTKADLSLSGTRTYDGSSAVAGSALTATGVAGETFAITGTGDTTNLASKNVQTGSALASVSGLALGAGANGGLSSNYNALSTAGSSVSITKADLTLSSSNVTKTYDATLTASGVAAVASGSLFGSDSLSGGTFAFTNANAGSGNKTVTASGVTVNDGNSGDNYNVSYADNTTSTINAAALLLSTGNVTKVYDGGLAAAGVAIITGGMLFGSDSFSGGTFVFADKNVGSGNKVVKTSGVIVSDDNGGANYAISYADNTASTITPASLAVHGVTANNKIYDGTTAATLAGSATVVPLGADAVAVSGAGSGIFADAQVGVGKAVAVSGFALSGSDAGNYTIVQPAGLTANIEALAVAPDSPPAPTPVVLTTQAAEIKNVAAQIQSSIFFQATTVPALPNLSPELATTQTTAAEASMPGAVQNVGMNNGRANSLLQIVDGGMKLPGSNVEENTDR